MAGLETLLPLIYHEAQQPGSMLCAQHALNSLLPEGNYFTAPDLSELARHLDDLERSYHQDIRGHASTNMDDTGFFSVQVLEHALQVWGLSLVRWRSEIMKPYHDHPHSQLAFVLNQNQHWYTLRRFGSSIENGLWFDLDSAKPSPQWVSKTYLGMFLLQAEQNGYSIFAVVPIESSNPYPLPHTNADDVASTLIDPSSSAPSSGSRISSTDPGLEDEDMDLQAALQASLASAEQRDGTSSSRGALNRAENYPSPIIPSSRTFPGFPTGSFGRQGTSGGRPNIPPNQDPYGNADVDPVSASMERNRVIMERMRQEQEAALRGQYEEEVAQFDQAREGYPRQGRGAEAEDEDELLRRAMEESLAEHRARGGDDVAMDETDEEEYIAPPGLNTHTTDRVYDDDDEELQAALKASLESMPPGFTLPPSAQLPTPQRLTEVSPSAGTSTSQTVEEGETTETEGETTETETEAETDAEGVVSETSQAAKEEVSLEEMRRRRLAKFGG